MSKMVINTSSTILPLGSVVRSAPRAADQRQDNYDELFDFRTLFYDAFETHSGIALIGPPLLNLSALVSDNSFEDEHGSRIAHVVRNLDRTSIIELEDTGIRQNTVTIRSKELVRTMSVGSSYLHLFEGRKVLVTKSKNNSLRWISDWVKFHVAEQGIDAVLLYDNGSTVYGPEDVLEAIAQSGVRAAVVVDWPFKFGPQGGSWNGLKGAPWDSDYCEYGIMEHARRRFLADAAGVLNADIDELVMTEGDETVFDALRDSAKGGLTYTGRWIETAGGTGDLKSFDSYSYYNPRKGPTSPKWAIDPGRVRHARQWRTHSIIGVELEKVSSTMHRHFMGISLNWKWQRSDPQSLSDQHAVDHDLRQALTRVFPEMVQRHIG